MKVSLILALICLPLLLHSNLQADEKPWIEVRSPHFRLITNGSRQDGSEVLRHFELMRAAFAAYSPGLKLDPPAPLLIIAAKDEKTTDMLLPGFLKHSLPLHAAVEEFRHGWERQYVLVRLDLMNSDPRLYHTVYHEYIHTLLHANLHWIPAWLDEGLADFYAYTTFAGNTVQIGSLPDDGSMKFLNDVRPIPLSDFLVPHMYTSDRLQSQVTLQAWALTHYLMMSPSMDSGQRLQRFIDAIQKRVEQKKAFQDSFGNFGDVEKAYKHYISSGSFITRVGNVPASLNDIDFSGRTLEPGEADAEFAAWFIQRHEWDAVRQFTQTALAANPKLSLAHQDNGFLLYNEGHDDEALKEFSTAVELDNKNYIALFAKIMISPAAKSTAAQDQQAVYSQLNQVIDLKADFAPAYVELAKLNIAMGNPRVALALSRKASQVEPFRAGYYVLSGRILLMMNKPSDAATEAAYVAQRWGGSDRDEAMELWAEIPAADRPADDLQLPLDPEEKKLASVEGKVSSVSCNGNNLALTLDVDGQSRTYKAKGFPVGFSDTFWLGHDHFSPCFHVNGLRVMLRYKPAKDSNAGDLVYAGFRDDLVPPKTDANQSTTQTK